MKIVSIVGARPQFVKLAPIAHACARHADIEHVIVHTGQHYDQTMSDVFFEMLDIPGADVDLGIGSGPHGAQTGAMLAAIEEVLEREMPAWTLVYGDTNSTLAGALAAVKVHVPVAHLEAGLRSFNRRMPEEHNRVLTDHAADLLLAPTDVAMRHLADEGLAARAVLVGDVMTDVCLRTAAALDGRPTPLPVGVDAAAPYLVATIHRADNTDEKPRLATILDQLAALPVPVVLAAHPRLVARAEGFGLELARGAIRTTEPLPYPDMIAAVSRSIGVVTDSGGLQKEAYLLGVPCTTVRTETEWPETLVGGWNMLDPDLVDLPRIALRPVPTAERTHPYGTGDAAERALDALLSAGR